MVRLSICLVKKFKNKMIFQFYFFVITKLVSQTKCISVGNWLGYKFVDNPNIYKGFCVIDHLNDTVKMDTVCKNKLPYIECFTHIKP